MLADQQVEVGVVGHTVALVRRTQDFAHPMPVPAPTNIAGQNALVLETADPREFVGLFRRLRSNPAEASALRRSGRSTAQRYAWPQVARGVLLPRIELARTGAGLLRRAALSRAANPPGASLRPHCPPAMRTPLALRAVIDALPLQEEMCKQ